MNIIVISIFLTVIWLLSMTLAFVAGRYSVRQEIEEADAKRETHYVVNTTGDAAVTREELKAVIDRVALVDRQLQVIHEEKQNAPADISMGAQRRLEMIEPLAERVKTLEETVEGYRDRFTRVERKAGMRV